MEEQKAVSEVEGKEVAEVSDDELATLIAEGKKLQVKLRQLLLTLSTKH